jgi:hypothetical protein
MNLPPDILGAKSTHAIRLRRSTLLLPYRFHKRMMSADHLLELLSCLISF